MMKKQKMTILALKRFIRRSSMNREMSRICWAAMGPPALLPHARAGTFGAIL
jgi:hypothetical protein